MKGNHLILFDGKKQQIIKLDASIGLKPLNDKKAAPGPPNVKRRNEVTYDENKVQRRGPGDLVDPN